MPSIEAVIARKRAEIAKLQTQIAALQEVLAETKPRKRGRPAKAKKAAPKKRTKKAKVSRPDLIEGYLKKHEGEQPAKEIAKALGLKPAAVHMALQPYLKKGARFAKGSARGSYKLVAAK